ncbi:MAG: hypothetical protein PWP27_1410 [Clostridiales bacterium]|jgi:uncharacterized membrane-anchored protein|nr:hypothetical protein [Clostridiales bacterium]MDK2933600.1 hypothetical protein [Clostridiales bacterium]
MFIKGYIRKGKKTKDLVKLLNTDNIPVICHEDLDEVAAYSLLETKIKAVINCNRSISGRYPTKGVKLLLQNGITVLDNLGEEFFQYVQQNDLLEIKNSNLFINGRQYNKKPTILNEEIVNGLIESSYKNFSKELEKFIDNTLEYAYKEKDIILKDIDTSFIKTNIENRHVLIVVRGCNYKQDLQTIKGYIKDFRPVLIGVDGGGDALLEFGLTPDIIVGDMDSVSDACLKKCKEIIVHAYPDGKAPGMKRINKLGLKAKLFPFTGTSEDVAMIIAYEKKADLIVAVGTHSNIIDFLEKGRKGMASTMLTRLKIGAKLVDAKGVSKLYSNKLKLSYCIPVLVSALIPIIAVIRIYIPIQILLNIFHLRFLIK